MFDKKIKSEDYFSFVLGINLFISGKQLADLSVQPLQQNILLSTHDCKYSFTYKEISAQQWKMLS